MFKPSGDTAFGAIYAIEAMGHPWLKVGYITLAKRADGYAMEHVMAGAKKRISELQTGCPLPLKLLHVYPCYFPATMETLIHTILHPTRQRGEWFAVSLAEVDMAFYTAKHADTNPDLVANLKHAYKEKYPQRVYLFAGDTPSREQEKPLQKSPLAWLRDFFRKCERERGYSASNPINRNK